MESFRNSLQLCAQVCRSLTLDFIVTGGKISKQYLQKKIKEIAKIYKKVQFLARQIIFKKLDFIPEFYEILQLSERCEKSVRSLVTSLVYQYTNNKQKFQITIFKDRIEEIQKHTDYIRRRLKLIVSHWDVDILTKMSQDKTKREQIQLLFKQKCIHLSQMNQQTYINQNQSKQIKNQLQQAQVTKKQFSNQEEQLNDLKIKKKEQFETINTIISDPTKKEMNLSPNSFKNKKFQEKQVQNIKKQEENLDSTIISIDD